MKQKIAFITGANKGIGYGIAEHLGKSGWQIVVSQTTEGRVKEPS